MLLGVGVGIRLARAHFDVKTEQEKQRREAALGIPSPATDDAGSASDKPTAISPPNDTATVAEAQDLGPTDCVIGAASRTTSPPGIEPRSQS
jgi:hypothetical protein